MPKFTAVMGKSKTNRIVSVGAATEEQARTEIIRQLSKNPQRRDILAQWQTSGATIVEEARSPSPPFDEAEANALIRGRLAELLAELEEWKPMFQANFSNVVSPPPVYVAYDRAKAALKAFDQGMAPDPMEPYRSASIIEPPNDFVRGELSPEAAAEAEAAASSGRPDESRYDGRPAIAAPGPDGTWT